MEAIYRFFVTIIICVSVGLIIGVTITTPYNISSVTEEKIITVDNNPDLELRLQSEIDSNQELAQMVTDILNACNEKLLDKYKSTNEKLEKENQILQKALSKFRQT